FAAATSNPSSSATRQLAEELVAFASSIALMSSTGIVLLLPVRIFEDIASRPVTTDHSSGQRRACQLVFGTYRSSGALPDQFWVGKFSCAGSAKFAPIPLSLDASERCAGIGAGEVIDKYHSRLDPADNS